MKNIFKVFSGIALSMGFVFLNSTLAYGESLPFKEGSFQIQPVTIHFWEKGKGEPVILIAGLFSSLERMDKDRLGFIIDNLAINFRVIVMEMRGHGKNSKPYSATEYGTEMATDVIRLMDHLELEKAHIMGYSYGALLAAKLIETFPERIEKVVLGGAAIANIEKISDFEWAWKYADSIENGEGLAVIARDLTPAGEEVNLDLIKLLNEKYLAPSDDLAMIAVLRGTSKLGINLDILETTSIPILMASGELDANAAEALALKEKYPALEVLIIPGKDHISAVTSPEFSEGVVVFLKK